MKRVRSMEGYKEGRKERVDVDVEVVDICNFCFEEDGRHNNSSFLIVYGTFPLCASATLCI